MSRNMLNEFRSTNDIISIIGDLTMGQIEFTNDGQGINRREFVWLDIIQLIEDAVSNQR